MSFAERLAKRARAAIEELAAAGATGDRVTERSQSFRQLGADARAIGLFDLAERLEGVARALDGQVDLGRAPNAALADALLASYDRIEALSATLAHEKLLEIFGADEGAA